MERKDLPEMNALDLSVSFQFSAAHTYSISEWDQEKNKHVFANNYSATPHGHNYKMIVTIRGNPDKTSGMVINFDRLEELVSSLVVQELDHKFLNEDVGYFQIHMPTTENVALYVWNKLTGNLESFSLRSVRIYEDESLYAEIKDEGKGQGAKSKGIKTMDI